MIRRSLDVFGLRPLDSLCRVFPDFLLDEAGAMPQGGFTRQLGTVGSLGAHILLFHLKELAMHEAVNRTASGPAHPPHRAGLFGWLLLCQLIFGRLQFFPALFHTELGRGGLFLLALLPKLRRRKLRFGSFGGAAAKIRPLRCSSSPHKVFRLCGAPHVLDTLSRSGLRPGPAGGALISLWPGLSLRAGPICFSLHSSNPPGGW